jgi:hypothetical protein
VIGPAIPEVAGGSPAEESPEDRLDCDLAGPVIAVKATVTTNAGNIIRRIISLAGLLSDWPTRRFVAHASPSNETCDSEPHLNDRIVSPRFDIGSASHTLATLRSNTYNDVFRMKASGDAHICSESQDVFVCSPFAVPKCRKISAFTEVSNTDQTICLYPGDDGQRMMVIAANLGAVLMGSTVPLCADCCASLRNQFGNCTAGHRSFGHVSTREEPINDEVTF